MLVITAVLALLVLHAFLLQKPGADFSILPFIKTSALCALSLLSPAPLLTASQGPRRLSRSCQCQRSERCQREPRSKLDVLQLQSTSIALHCWTYRLSYESWSASMYTTPEEKRLFCTLCYMSRTICARNIFMLSLATSVSISQAR